MSRFLLICLFFSIVFSVFAIDLPVSQIPDDSSLRLRLKDTWLTETPARVLAKAATIEPLQNGDRVEVSAEEGREEILVRLSRELRGTFPGWAQGSWMITRRKDTGEGTLIRIFLRSDPYTYVQFRRFNEDKCQMDVVLYGAYIVHSMPLAVPFERLYTMQLNDILNLAGTRFPRRYFDPNPEYYRDSRTLITQIRNNLTNLRFADDGAIDENGSFVFINTLQPQNSAAAGLNCSGFTKWLIDGILRPVTGRRLSIPPLKEPFGDRGSSFTANWEERRDPYFGLDWIRNLAAEANETLRSPSFRSLNEFEVRNCNFSLLLVSENRSFVTHSYPGFMEDAGFGIEGLRPLLYTLAIDQPFNFYLAAVNTEIGAPVTVQNPRGTPRFRQYFHVAAIFPYFDEHGVFRIVVFESAAETSFAAFRSRYPGHFINLVQIPVTAVFDP